jgi:hypothetical protein
MRPLKFSEYVQATSDSSGHSGIELCKYVTFRLRTRSSEGARVPFDGKARKGWVHVTEMPFYFYFYKSVSPSVHRQQMRTSNPVHSWPVCGERCISVSDMEGMRKRL